MINNNRQIFRRAAAISVILSTVLSCSGKMPLTPAESFLELEGPPALAAPEEGTAQEYAVDCDGEWEIVRRSVQTWAEARPASGKGDGTFRISVGENKTGVERSMRFTFMLDGKEVPEKEISITQRGTKQIRDEAGEVLTVIKPGVTAYGATELVYRRDKKAMLDVSLAEPVVIASAAKPEGWGYFQFPKIYKSADGRLVATWAMAADNESSYGKEGFDFRVSSDNGKTWTQAGETAPWGNGLIIPATGERLTVHTPVASNVNGMQLPESLGSVPGTYGGTTYRFYRMSEIPEEVQGCYLNRWDANGSHSLVHAPIDDPGAVRYASNNLFPVVWWGDMKLLPDNSLVTGIYPMFYELPTGGVAPSGVSFYRSADYGNSWKILAKIPYTPDLAVDPNANKRLDFGYSEPAFEVLSDGTFLCVMRTDSGLGRSPMYISRSTDQGVTWSKAVPFTPWGVLPRLLQLDNGVTVLASGRPGVQLRFSTDGKGEKWTDPFEMLPYTANTQEFSCGYTGLLATGPDTFLFIYSDFKYVNGEAQVRKAIKVREVKVIKR